MGRCAVSTQKQKRPFALRALAAFAGTLAILFVLLLAAYALPGERVRQHVYDSARTIQNEGLYPEYLGFKLFQMDNYTDTLMLFEAASADELPPLQAMMTNTAYNVDNFETLADDLAWYIEKDWSTGAQRARYVCKALALRQGIKHHGRFTNRLDNDRNGAFLRVPIHQGHRHSFAGFVRAQNNKLPGFGRFGHQRFVNDKFGDDIT